jgi:hypothetical protein
MLCPIGTEKNVAKYGKYGQCHQIAYNKIKQIEI